MLYYLSNARPLPKRNQPPRYHQFFYFKVLLVLLYMYILYRDQSCAENVENDSTSRIPCSNAENSNGHASVSVALSASSGFQSDESSNGNQNSRQDVSTFKPGCIIWLLWYIFKQLFCCAKFGCSLELQTHWNGPTSGKSGAVIYGKKAVNSCTGIATKISPLKEKVLLIRW